MKFHAFIYFFPIVCNLFTFSFSNKLKLLCLLLVLFVGLAAVALYFAVFQGHDEHIKRSEQLKVANRNAVVANGNECASIGL